MNVRNSNKAIIIKEGKLLVIAKKDESGIYYTLPGGGQEFGETIYESLIRECIEETGLIVKVGELMYIRDYRGENHEFANLDKDVHQVEPMFLCEIINDNDFGKTTVPDNWQIGLEWLEIKNLSEYNLFPAVLKTLIPNMGKEKQNIYLGDVN